MKKAYFKKNDDKFGFVGFFSDEEAKRLGHSTDDGYFYSDDDLYKLIDAAKDALNNIPLDQK